jgi:hypothetical protein
MFVVFQISTSWNHQAILSRSYDGVNVGFPVVFQIGANTRG